MVNSPDGSSHAEDFIVGQTRMRNSDPGREDYPPNNDALASALFFPFLHVVSLLAYGPAGEPVIDPFTINMRVCK